METKKDPWTLQQKFGFQDDDLKSPKHDDIMVWLDTNIEEIFQNKLNHYLTYFEQQWNKSVQNVIHRFGICDYQENNLPYKMEITKKIWEMPIVKNNYTIGFVDFVINIKYPELSSFWNSEIAKDDVFIRDSNCSFAFEVKTVIPSVGELIRQIRMYQTYLADYPFYVVAPDDKYEQVLKSQNIGFIKYTG